MLQNTADQQTLIDKADDLHLRAAFRAFQWIDFPDLLDTLSPGFEGILRVSGSVMVKTSAASVIVSAFASDFVGPCLRRSPRERFEYQP